MCIANFLFCSCFPNVVRQAAQSISLQLQNMKANRTLMKLRSKLTNVCCPMPFELKTINFRFFWTGYHKLIALKSVIHRASQKLSSILNPNFSPPTALIEAICQALMHWEHFAHESVWSEWWQFPWTMFRLQVVIFSVESSVTETSTESEPQDRFKGNFKDC